MKLLIQRVHEASVKINNKIHSQIDEGLLVYLCFEADDPLDSVPKASKKICSLRIFEDENSKMNLSVNQIGGDVLLVSQFTLSWSGDKGNRPNFEKSMHPKKAQEYYDIFCQNLKNELNKDLKTGVFGANMKVSSINNGPVTFFLNF